MRRAAVLIGVNKTGGLPVLDDAVRGANLMKDWALNQGMAEKDILLFTDEAGPVEVGSIRKGIRGLVDMGTVGQLLIYFAGHGVNIRYGEFWLLSDAPIDASAAVNVEGSVVLARRCGIDHVIFVSDACRTAAEGVQAQGITGSEIFPNDPVGGQERPVDLFFATTLGRPALEVKSAADSSSNFRAVYTEALLDAVGGKLASCVSTASGAPPFVVRPRSLKMCLNSEVPHRLSTSGVGATVSQEPDARITSDETAWVAGFNVAPQEGPATRSARGAPSGAVTRLPSLPVIARRLLESALSTQRTAPGSRTRTNTRSTREKALSSELAERLMLSPRQLSSGFELQGATLQDALASNAQVHIVSTDRSLASVSCPFGVTNVLLVLTGGGSVILPAIPGFIAVLSFERGELADVEYRPLPGTTRFEEFAQNAEELRQLRAVIAMAAREGVFRLERADALEFARRMQASKNIDPSLALYAAYAFHSLQQHDRLREMLEYQRTDVKMCFFDLELLAGELWRGDGTMPHYPPLPMLAQGWSLLSALGGSLRNELASLPSDTTGSYAETLQSHLVDGLWTQFKPTATSHLRQLILKGKL